MIFYQLSPLDLKASVLVSRGWREVGEGGQGLWTWVWIKVNRTNMAKIPEILNFRRLQGLFTLEVEPPKFRKEAPKEHLSNLLRALF